MIRVVVWGKLAGPPHLTSGVACEQWSRPNIRWSCVSSGVGPYLPPSAD